ncbi:hypothetical protein NA57DRAFT_74670 [Rhizodiscina lignyota]|uniref:Uncharacterized protein n=1 Tax=Rhizodiscina lignyota TaxID=1504668 RepID=A0A9P4MCW9_9PEZI|nr:hypothetical protein NA57DRAFT_74670 [Rhizodiscina lignyota]
MSGSIRIIPERNKSASTNDGSSSSPPSSSATATTPAKATANKNFTFLTITDPKQARDKKNKKSVRSHVMFDYAARQKSGAVESGEKSGRRKFAKPRQRGSKSSISGSSTAHDDEFASFDEVVNDLNRVRDLAQTLKSQRSNRSDDPAATLADAEDISRYYRTLMTLNKLGSKGDKPQDVLNQDDDTFEMVWKAGFVKPYMIRGLGNEVDPFFVLPQFRSPMIYMAELKMWCTRRFGTKAMAISWVPTLARSRFSYLASLTVGATDMDVANGLRGDSALTVAVKTEVIEMVNESIADPVTQFSDETLMSITLLLCSEVVTANEWILDIHENGVTKMLLHKGGLRNLGLQGELAVAIHITIVLMNVSREKQPHQLYKDFVPLKLRAVSTKRAIPENPVYCPRGDFFTVVRSKTCTEPMYEILCDTRDLTDLLFQRFLDVDCHDKPDDVIQREFLSTAETPCEFQAAADATLKRIEAIPPLRRDSGMPLSYTTWMFETVRIVSLIYVTAIAKGVPFSKAATMVDARCESIPNLSSGTLPTVLHALVTALTNSNTSEAWADMSGVLYWCVVVGAAAARKRTTEASWTDDDEWVRRYLVATGVRISILLCFEHAEPATVSLRRVNKVQELLEKRGKFLKMIGVGDTVEVSESVEAEDVLEATELWLH